MDKPLLDTPISRRGVLIGGGTLIFASALAYAGGPTPAYAQGAALPAAVPTVAEPGSYYAYTPNIPVNALPHLDAAAGKPATASSFVTGGSTPFNATDQYAASSWAAKDAGAKAWWQVDLQGYFDLTGARIVWPEARPASSFAVETSTDGTKWTTVLTGTDSPSAPRFREEAVNAGNVRFVRVSLNPTDASAPVGIADFQVYGDVKPGSDVALGKIAFASAGELAAHAVDGDPETVWTAEGLYWKVDLRGKHSLTGTELTWSDGSKSYFYTVDVSTDGKTWQTVVDHAADGVSGRTQTATFTAEDVTHVRLSMIAADGNVAALQAFKAIGTLSPSTNVALGKDATASSGWAPYNANDGKNDTIWVAGDGNASWWKVDLGELHDLNSVSTTWENGSAQYNFIVEASADGDTWTKIADRAQNPTTQQPFVDSVDAKGVRYVRVSFLGASGGWWGAIRECIILGIPSNDDHQPRDVVAGKPAYTNDTKSLADRGNANDGSADTAFAFATLGTPYVFQVDLRTEHNLSAVEIAWTRFGADKPYQVQVSRDASTWKTVAEATAMAQNRQQIAATNVRFVRLNIPSTGKSYGSSIAALRVLGARANAADLARDRKPQRGANADIVWWQVELSGLAELQSVGLDWASTKGYSGHRVEVTSDFHVWLTAQEVSGQVTGKEQKGAEFRANNVRGVRVIVPNASAAKGTSIRSLRVTGRITRDETVLNLEAKQSFQYFWDLANTDRQSGAFGLVAESTARLDGAASVSGAGFGLAALAVGAERGWITVEQGYERALGTLETLLGLEHVRGVFYHYYNRQNGDVWVWPDAGKSEVGLIDTQLLFNGVIVAGEYFGGAVKERADELYARVDWKFFRDPSSNHFQMSYFPDEEVFRYFWNWSSEGKVMYVLGAGSPTHAVDPSMFYSFHRQVGIYDEYPSFINTWFGSLFTYQYAEAVVDFRNSRDKQGVDWWRNSILAGKTNRQYTINEDATFRTFSPDLWGMAACGTPTGYNSALGAPPSGVDNTQHQNDGTLTPSGAAGSVAQDPEYATRVLDNMYYNYPKLWGKYGFTNAFNLDVEPVWFSDEELALDKGVGLFAIENNRSGLIWRLFMQSPHVQAGMKKIDITYEPDLTGLRVLIAEASFLRSTIKDTKGKHWKARMERLESAIASAETAAVTAASAAAVTAAVDALHSVVKSTR